MVGERDEVGSFGHGPQLATHSRSSWCAKAAGPYPRVG